MGYLTTRPDLAQWTAEYMAAVKAASPTWMNGAVPLSDFQLGASEVEGGRMMMVDVGGGLGHQCLALRRARPELGGRMVVQDVGFMVSQVDRVEAEREGVEVMVHDFLTAQAVRGAKVYYLRTVLHDWGDEKCKVILGHLRDAMVEDSVVVIDEIVVPAKGASAAQMHFDLAMMAVLGAMERSEVQWRELLQAVGLGIRDVWIYDRGLNSGLIVGVPA